jgi:hypothetical protein
LYSIFLYLLSKRGREGRVLGEGRASSAKRELGKHRMSVLHWYLTR